MTIYIYSGVVGSGKSLHAASDIRFDLNRKRPRPVIANFEINKGIVRNPDMFTYCPNSELTADFLTDFAADYWSGVDFFKENFLHLYIDEAQLLFNSRCWSNKDRLEQLELFSQSRKLGYKVVFIAQSSKMVDNQFRMLVEYEVNHRRVDGMGVLGTLLALPFRNRLFMWVEYLFQTQERLGYGFHRAHKYDMQLYDSYKRFDGSMARR